MALDFLVRMRYDANEATHVKDLVGGYTIATKSGAIPYCADPFGGNNALDMRDNYIAYDGEKIIPGDKSTVCFWVKYFSEGQNYIVCSDDQENTANDLRSVATERGNFSWVIRKSNSYSFIKSGYNPPTNQWLYVEVNSDGAIGRIFVNGTLLIAGTAAALSSVNMWKKANKKMFIGNSRWNYNSNDKLNGALYDFCILNGVWHTENYNVPTAYISNIKRGICISKSPINLLDKTSITGITTEGIQPANTTRHVAFKVDDVWKKLTIASGGAATLTDLATQNITAASLISEGNTAAELANVTSVPGFVGKLVYPAIALYVSEEATAMPTFGLKVNTITDRNKNSITSPVYHISDTEITITDIMVNKKIVGNAGINIFASIKNSNGWSFYTDIDNIINKKATDIKFIYTFYVKECNGENSAHLIDIAINYDQDNPTATLSGDFKISPLILCINEKENGLTHYKFNYVEEAADTTNGKIPRRCFTGALYKVSS